MTMGHVLRNDHGSLAVYLLLITLFCSSFAKEEFEIIGTQVHHNELGGIANITCQVIPVTADVKWIFNATYIKDRDGIKIKEAKIPYDGMEYKESELTIISTTKDDAGNYTCEAKYGEKTLNGSTELDLSFPAEFVNTKGVYYANATSDSPGHSVTMKCLFKTYYKPQNVTWRRRGNMEFSMEDATWINLTHVESNHNVSKVLAQHNGTYECKFMDTKSSKEVIGTVDLIVYSDPAVEIDSVIGISKTELYVKWTVYPHNSEIVGYAIKFKKSNLGGFTFTHEKPKTNNTSFVITNLEPATEYAVMVLVKTKHGNNDNTAKSKSGSTLDKDPVFVPSIAINGFSATSVTIGWAPPPSDIAHLIHYYLLEARKKDGGTPRKAYHSRDARNLPYMFDNLEPHSTYIFKVRACQDYNQKCWDWSDEMEAATLDGVPGKPSNVSANCTSSVLSLYWDAPLKPNAEIKGYTMELTGVRKYKDNKEKMKKETWGPLSRFLTNTSRYARFDDLLPNAEYTVKLSAMTRTRRRGDEEIVHCTTQVAPPERRPGAKWSKIYEKEKNKYLFQMQVTKVPERNGPLCCYRVHIVRLPPRTDLKHLPPQHQLEVIDYEQAHGVQPVKASYVTDIFTNDDFPDNDVLTLTTGDGVPFFNSSEPVFKNETCQRCLLKPERQPPVHDTPAPPKVVTTTENDDDIVDATTTTIAPVVEDKKERRRRDAEDTNYAIGNKDYVKVRDGPLDSESNYTFFVELIPGSEDMEPMYSEYQHVLRPAPSPVATAPASPLEIALQATCAVAALVLLVMIIFCVLQTRRSRKMPPHAQLEMTSPLQAALNYVRVHIGGGSQRLPLSTPPDMPPIAKEDLAAAYAERHADSDYGFQKEFELLQMLSESFPDRTTHASEARENQPKNRYPDIKAYDQTRVKLSQIDGITGSDYINANYVRGYKEPKKFICAQGPTDTTVNDFWRMIWEHGLELIVMLTNLEEYSKVKCSKYWPDEVRGAKAFGNITVHHVSEKRYSDYIVRELRITKHPTNAEGQPIVENNGIAKRNGDIKEPSSESAPTSPRETKEAGESRIVKQYHFLMWKDFAAPEHPHSILKFIKRVNEAWASMVGRPVVVHCSAGVGRTGTLVALDCLLEQLRATQQVAVFNTIAELRRQRNFLVQSQKQYVFVYRALVEYAHYGDTEIPASKLKSSIDRLRNTPEGADKCLMEHEFEKLLDSPVAEVVKSCAAGGAEEVRGRNRAAERLPYDRNRVMLAPLPARDCSTYINASFLEAYDNSEGFIITQDPLPSTIFDFWRMVSEQGISTIVMLSELGEGKCPRYWDDGTVQYEHISVQYDESESCPYYTRRQFRVTNTKSGQVQAVRQLQYHGWPTAPGHVPEVTRGLAELADAAAPHRAPDTPQPMLVHCHTGTERSALFVALCILICQLRAERRVDVSAVARRVRTQRSHTIDTFLQYEFLHRAILNYAELHNLLEDS